MSVSCPGSSGRTRCRSASVRIGSATTGPVPPTISTSTPAARSGTTMSEKRTAASTPCRRTGCRVISVTRSGRAQAVSIGTSARTLRYSGSERPACRMNHTGGCGTGSRRQARRKADPARAGSVGIALMLSRRRSRLPARYPPEKPDTPRHFPRAGGSACQCGGTGRRVDAPACGQGLPILPGDADLRGAGVRGRPRRRLPGTGLYRLRVRDPGRPGTRGPHRAGSRLTRPPDRRVGSGQMPASQHETTLRDVGSTESAMADVFAQALASLRGTPVRPEVTLAEIPAPKRIAPYSFALSAEARRDDVEVASGRLVVLYDPDGQPGWEGELRLVTFV